MIMKLSTLSLTLGSTGQSWLVDFPKRQFCGKDCRIHPGAEISLLFIHGHVDYTMYFKKSAKLLGPLFDWHASSTEVKEQP